MTMPIDERNLDSLCRFCLDLGNTSIDENISELDGRSVSAFLGSTLCPPKPKYPTKMCAQCAEVVLSFYNFTKLCHKTQINLNALLGTVNETNGSDTAVIEMPVVSERSDSAIKPAMGIATRLSVCMETNDSQDLVSNPDHGPLYEDIDKSGEKWLDDDAKLFAQHNGISDQADLNGSQCSICRTFVHTDKLQKHMLNAHGINLLSDAASPDSFLCKICGKALKSKESLVRHEKLHEGIFEFSCPECNARFATRSGLNSHKRQHTGSLATLPCDLCRKIFRTKASLDRHKLWHAGTKDYECETCNSSFYTVFELKSHIKRVHGQTFCECCVHCKKEFKSAEGLRRHIMVHKNIRPFQCAICEKEFITRSKLKFHLKSMHGIEAKLDNSYTVWRDPKTFYTLKQLLDM